MTGAKNDKHRFSSLFNVAASCYSNHHNFMLKYAEFYFGLSTAYTIVLAFADKKIKKRIRDPQESDKDAPKGEDI